MSSRCIDPTCNAISLNDGDKCDICEEPVEVFPLYQPKGFVTVGKPRDYDGQRNRGPSILPANISFFLLITREDWDLAHVNTL